MAFKGKVYVADDSLGADVIAASQKQAESIFSRIVNYYATEAERDAATSLTGSPAPMTAAEKLGMKCYVDTRKSWYGWDGSAWQPETQERLLADWSEPSRSDLSTTAPTDLLAQSTFTLPGSVGARRIKMVGSAYVTNAPGYSGDGYPRIMLAIGSTQIAQQQQQLPNGNAIDLRVDWTTIVSAGSTITPKLQGLVAGGSPIAFYSKALQVFDLGPTA